MKHLKNESWRSFIKNSGLLKGAGGLAGFSCDLPQRNVDYAAIQNNYKCDILVVGGSFGGCAAALAAAKLGKEVIITEETSWIGGQATTQGVPMEDRKSVV